LANEHCSYFGAFCKGGDRGSYGILSSTYDSKDRNGTQKVVLDAPVITKSLDLAGARGLIKVCQYFFSVYVLCCKQIR
jgi:hypothetical protein